MKHHKENVFTETKYAYSSFADNKIIKTSKP